MNPKVITIGVFGYDEQHFFQALVDAQVDLFVDIRRRRALRGGHYAFANSTRLQGRLDALGIRYIHRLDLAPSNATRQVQEIHDRMLSISKRQRQTLSPDFIAVYQRECLDHFDVQQFLDDAGPQTRALALFCVEGEPHACHRSLVAERLAAYRLEVVHLTPD